MNEVSGFRSTQAAVRATAMTKRYGAGHAAVTALDDVTVAFPTGSITAVLGPSGSGKSTLLHCLAGLDTVTSGAVYLGETELTTLSEQDRTRVRRDRIGFVFQSFNLLPVLTAGENILLPSRIAERVPDPAWVERVIDAVGLRDRLRHRPSALSGGEQQRLAVARAIVGRPEVIFADEPTGNLDSRARADLLRLLRRCVDELGQTVVMVSHDPTAAGYADVALFVEDGRVVGEMDSPTAERVLSRVWG
jgi:putative ABC transport system ATP-binding protein